MRTVRLTIVSDSHLSPKTPEALANWEALAAYVEQTGPDAVIHTGDITLDGTTDRRELGFARRHLDAMPAPVLALPGNHDLGDNPNETNGGSRYLIDDDRVAAYRDLIGEDRWATDIGGWRLVGFNAQLLDSGLADEEEQWSWLENELRPEALADHHPAVFLHKPLLHSDPQPDEHDLPVRYVRRTARERLLAMLTAAGVRVVVSGHVHQFRRFDAHRLNHVWAPTSWATIPATHQATIGERWVGGLDLALGDDGSVAVEHVRPAGVDQHIIGETIPNPY
jgi:3',5'-cyclic AMP phosphodiesterase CpdA